MHDNHEPSCALCAKFVLPFGPDSPLADWGYCLRESGGVPPSAEELERVDEQARRGDYRFLREGRFSLYEALGEGCDDFEDAGH